MKKKKLEFVEQADFEGANCMKEKIKSLQKSMNDKNYGGYHERGTSQICTIAHLYRDDVVMPTLANLENVYVLCVGKLSKLPSKGKSKGKTKSDKGKGRGKAQGKAKEMEDVRVIYLAQDKKQRVFNLSQNSRWWHMTRVKY